jgi:hypothetical protein
VTDDAAARERSRRFVEQLLDVHRERYERTKNPRYAWLAIRDARRKDVPWPSWAIGYLDRVAGHISDLARAPSPSKNALPRAVYRALEFDTRASAANPFTNDRKVLHDVDIAIDVKLEIRHERARGNRQPKLEAIFAAVAAEHPARCAGHPRCTKLSAAHVKRIWHTHRATVER